MASGNPEIVRLNVGGRHFTTTRTTLTSFTYSVIGRMFSKPNPTMLDEEGRYFIDRDGDAFVPVLEYLRSNRYFDFGISKARVRAEAEFFGLDKLALLLGEPEPKKMGIFVFKDGDIHAFPLVSS